MHARSRDPVIAALYAARRAHGLTLEQLSQLAYGNTSNTNRLSLYERGEKSPTLHSLRVWVQALGMELIVVPGDQRLVGLQTRAAGQPSFTCPKCQATSYHPGDIRHGYCGRCHEFTGTEEGP